jgi:hypothetical protein
LAQTTTNTDAPASRSAEKASRFDDVRKAFPEKPKTDPEAGRDGA